LHYLLSVPRPELNRVLMEAAEAEENVTCFFDRKLLDVDLPPMPARPTGSSDTHTTLVFRNMNADESGSSPDPTVRRVVKAVLGCDGMFSRVRAAIQRKQPRFNFSQQFIPAGYKELSIPPRPLGKGRDRWRLDPNALHLWPRGQFMMIAQPNHDGSFSCTLFMPFLREHSPTGAFDMLNTEDDVLSFFRCVHKGQRCCAWSVGRARERAPNVCVDACRKHFSDAIELLPTLLTDWFARPTSPLCTVRCAPFNYGGAALLIGDAAHAIVPFYGQGCNAAFEDVSLLDELWKAHSNDTAEIFRAFSNQRK
jgi:kynurenine 3-monooxygenase